MDTKAIGEEIVRRVDWSEAPRRVEYGTGMMVADIELSKDETLTVYVHQHAIKSILEAKP